MDRKDELYAKLKTVAVELTEETGRPVTIREALLQLLKAEGLAVGDFAWSWRIKEQARSRK